MRLELEFSARYPEASSPRDGNPRRDPSDAKWVFRGVPPTHGNLRTDRHVGLCIYCGSLSGPLSKEHVIPNGLLPIGIEPLLLRDASCRDCARITSGFETAVLRRLWLPARAGLRLRSYRKRQRPRSFPLTIKKDGQLQEVWLGTEEYPAVVIFPTFTKPAYLDGRPYSGGIDVNGTVTIQVAGPPVPEVAKKLGANTFEFKSTFEHATYERVLLKVAYAFTVFRLGLEGIKQAYVLPAILGQSNDIGRWLGCDERELLSLDTSLAIGLAVLGRDIVCRVRLFSRPAPEYVVVVGRVVPEAAVAQ